ncbi:MAG: glycosyltransferase [Minisyncoccia bacterium]
MEKISVIIPAFNEEKNIGEVVKSLKEIELIDEIIVVSDGSKDKTVLEAEKAGADIVIDLPKNLGKGGAILEGIKKANGDILIFLDADLIGIKRDHILNLLEPLKKDEADMVVGYLAGDKMQNLIPYLSGQRALRKKDVLKIIKNKKFIKSRYKFEVLLNRFYNRSNLKTIFIPLFNIDHITKRKKYNFFRAIFYKIRSAIDFLDLYKTFLSILIVFILGFFSYIIFIHGVNYIKLNLLGIVPVPNQGDKILVIVAHPDDEIIGSFGYIYEAIKNKAYVKVIIVTNGDANKWSAYIFDKKIRLKNKDFIKEGERRMEESKNALKLAGVNEENIIFLGFPDRGLIYLLNKNWDKPLTSKYTKWNKNNYSGTYKIGSYYTGENLSSLLEEIIASTSPTVIITHHPEDKNPDHEAVFRFTKIALIKLIERKIINPPIFYSFLVHYKITEYPLPFRLQFNGILYPPKDLLKKCDWKAFYLSYDAEYNKMNAIKFYKDQLESPYLNLLLKSFIRKNELFCEIIKFR